MGNITVEGEFVALVNANRQRILRICRVYAGNAQDEEDLYQEILFQIWRALPTLKTQAHANTWLYRIALNTAVSYVRKQSVAVRQATPTGHQEITAMLEHRQETAPPQPRMELLYEAIAQLDKAEKAIITLFLEDFSYDEIGEVLGLNASHVGVMLHRAKKKLSLLMKEEAP